jgi:uncharacterized protein
VDINGEYVIPADRDTVWNALNDPEVLKECIPGCQELAALDDGDGFEATVLAKIGPVKATFKGSVRLEDVVEGESYTIVGEGKGGTAGFAKLKSRVNLEDAGNEGTRLKYTADAQLGGKLAQLGARLIQGTARKYADDFFGCFVARLSPEEDAGAAVEGAQPEGAESRRNWMIYGGAALLVLIVLWLLFGR